MTANEVQPIIIQGSIEKVDNLFYYLVRVKRNDIDGFTTYMNGRKSTFSNAYMFMSSYVREAIGAQSRTRRPIQVQAIIHKDL